MSGQTDAAEPNDAFRAGFHACQQLAARRYDDAARYVRLRARSEADHNVAATYEQAAAMIRAMPIPERQREATGLEYRGG